MAIYNIFLSKQQEHTLSMKNVIEFKVCYLSFATHIEEVHCDRFSLIRCLCFAQNHHVFKKKFLWGVLQPVS